MKLSISVPVAAWGVLLVLLTSGACGALPLAHPGPTVDDYTAAQSQHAQAAARRAGFGDLEIVMVQDGNFFLNGQKEGRSYSLTVTRDGEVYASAGSPADKS